MSRKVLKQYLELLNYSGIDSMVQLKDSSIETGINNKDSLPLAEENSVIDTSSVTVQPETSEKKIKMTEPIHAVEGKELYLKQKQLEYSDCTKCGLYSNRIKFVYGEGNPDAGLMLIGEGPGAEENKQGRPFVGRAGQLLTNMLTAIHLQREDVYIANIVKCQPPDNRNPQPEEASKCLPYLWEQIKIIQPRLIVLLGKVAALNLLGESDTLGSLRLREFRLNPPDATLAGDNSNGIETYVTYHPAALLRNPSLKKFAWIDLQKYRDILGIKP